MSLEKKQQEFVQQLLPLSMEPRFDDVFDRLLASESKSSRFLIKMELGRLTSECIRVIDLRGRPNIACEEFITGKQRHYIDKLTKETFNQALAKYKGQYTTGVYEYVIESIKQRRHQTPSASKAQSSLSRDLIPAVNLGHYTQRAEERMNYSIKVSVLQPDTPAYDAVTLDISVTGARIKLPQEHNLDFNRTIHIRFVGLEKEYFFKELEQALAYEVVSCSTTDTHHILGLKRLEGSLAFSNMLSNLITGYKFRYKVNIEDLHTNIPGLNLELHYLINMPHMPLFVGNKDNKHYLSHKLLTQKNHETLNYFLDENSISQLPSMLNQSRLTALLSSDTEYAEELYYCFTYNVKGKLFFYSASLSELKQQDKLALFFSFGAAKASWRVFHVCGHKLSHQQGYKNSILPGDNADYSALTRNQIQLFSHQLTLTDITNQHHVTEYQAWQHKANPNILKNFSQEKILRNSIKGISLQKADKRQEARFALKTLVNMTQAGIKAQGITLDISNKGLQINLEDPREFNLNQPVMISLPKLQKLSKKNQLHQLPYKIVRIRSSNTLFHVCAMFEETPHQGVEFLKRLIESNKTKLKALSESGGEVREIAAGLKNLTLRQINVIPFTIEKEGKVLRISEIAVNKVNTNLASCFSTYNPEGVENSASNEELFDFSEIFDQDKFHQLVEEPLESMQTGDTMKYSEVFLCYRHNQRAQSRITNCLIVDETCSLGQQQEFIQSSNNKGRFIALRLGIAPCATTSLQHVTQELNYLTIHSPNKAKKLEEKLWRIHGIGEFMDITYEVLQRSQFNQEQSKSA